MNFKKIPNEEFRVYTFPDGNRVKIDKPQKLDVTENGHKIVDGNGNGHYVPYGWIHIFMKFTNGEFAF